MNVCITPSVTGGEIRAIASKSVAHRMLICAAFAKADTNILCQDINEDIEATARCLSALGAEIKREGDYLSVRPVRELRKGALLDCGESGSTLRFILPVAALLGAEPSFAMGGRLPSRPLSPLREELERFGVEFSASGSNPMWIRGRAESCEFNIRGDVSSQFISGLMLALAVSGRVGKINIIGELQSAPYIDITAAVIRAFGATVSFSDNVYEIDARGGLLADGELFVEGDWSNAAVPLCLGAVGEKAVTVTGIDRNSPQGDKYIIGILEKMGADVAWRDNAVTVYPSPLRGARVDASQVPDLVPVVAALCALSEGESVIYNAERLRIKESDRLLAVATTLNALGASVEERQDGLVIRGVSCLDGGQVSSFGDHRIVMCAAVASVRCKSDVVIVGAETVAKSYPRFFRDMAKLGMRSDAGVL